MEETEITIEKIKSTVKDIRYKINELNSVAKEQESELQIISQKLERFDDLLENYLEYMRLDKSFILDEMLLIQFEDRLIIIMDVLSIHGLKKISTLLEYVNKLCDEHIEILDKILIDLLTKLHKNIQITNEKLPDSSKVWKNSRLIVQQLIYNVQSMLKPNGLTKKDFRYILDVVQEVLQELKEIINGKQNDAGKFFEKVWNLCEKYDLHSPDNNEIKVLKKQIAEAHEDFLKLSQELNRKEAILQQHNDKYNRATDEYQKLQRDIKDLLGDATTIWLAKGYAKSKDGYAYHLKPREIFKQQQISNAVIPMLNFILSFITSKLFWHYALFLMPIGFVVWKNYISDDKIDLQQVLEGNIKIPLEYVWISLLHYLPLLLLIIFGWATISMHRKLYEEYNHKQRIVEFFNAFDDEFEDSESKDLLMEAMLEAVAHRPSMIVQKDMESPLEKITNMFKSKNRKKDYQDDHEESE